MLRSPARKLCNIPFVWLPMVEVKILSRHDCHLCEVVMKMARRVQAETPFCLHQVDIDEDRRLSERYGGKVPVILIDQDERFWGLVREQDLRRAIKQARWRRPISRILSRLRLRRQRG